MKLAVGDVGIGIGDVPRLDGLRLNFRDRHLQLVRGVNVTLWKPHDDAAGTVEGFALGLPLTGADRIRGIAVAGGLEAGSSFEGIGVTALGIGAGEHLRGVAVAGLGVGTEGEAEGVLLGGLGAGAGGDLRGIVLGGLGAGAGGSITGVAVGGLGAGAGGAFRGIGVGGLGIGAAGGFRGIGVGGLGVGSGGDMVGIAVGGLGVGAGNELRGIGLAGGRVQAARITGIAASGIMANTADLRGVVVAPAYFRIREDGHHGGVSLSAVHRVDGTQTGVTIGLVNIARDLHGLQVGLLNIALNKERYRALPLMNYHR